MMKNYTVMFLMFFVASIMGGFAFNHYFDYSMIVGFGLGLVFLLCSVFAAVKDFNTPKTQ